MTTTTTEHPDSGQLTPEAQALIADTRAVVARGLAPDLTAYLVGERLRERLGRPDLLTAAQCEPDPERYRQHLLHTEEDGSFSVIALVWLPGQRTGIHDHVCWGVAGVHQGQETERRYRLVPDGPCAQLLPTGELVGDVGSVSAFTPPGDIHRVRNAGSELAVSIHIYGADVRRLGSSVRRMYPSLAGEQD
ncbi:MULTISPECIES: cysteine dioxygenase family protein [Kitasatospora]|uniref:cysteine dioxygenase family protein n=1 Tax=Kitasatospora TaxID=2063 RepID=UPI000C70336C|nr:cysteine dioxygenase family protein [Kitasatospora sp. GP30]MDH6144406.1 putative metal-dependent enzyme (double-stranded beta helix superfamily) [Kitasatospora sp. GP30]